MRRSEGSKQSLSDRLGQDLARLSDRALDGWHRLSDRVAAKRAEIAQDWHRFSDRITTGPTRLGDRFLDRWYRLSDRIAVGRTRLGDRFLDRWYRLSDPAAARWEELHDRMSHPETPFRSTLLAGLLCGMIVMSGLVLLRAGRDTSVSREAAHTLRTAVASIEDPMRRGLSSGNEDLPGYEVHLNEMGRYLFSYPDRWELTTTGDEARLASPDDEVIMTFGIGPSGSLEAASDRVLANVTNPYANVDLVAAETKRTAQGLRSIVAGADALDAGGARVRFLVITIKGPDTNRAITVRFSPSADPLEASPAIQEIISSFRVSQIA
jgi:hypothetical protein